MSEPDRVSYSTEFKINMGNYESAGIHVGMSSDVKDGESPEKAFRRVKKVVEHLAEKEASEIHESREKGREDS